MRRISIGVLALAALLLSGCSQSDHAVTDSAVVSSDDASADSATQTDPQVNGSNLASSHNSSLECEEAMSATAETADDDVNAAFFHTIEVCGTARNWMIALEEYPSAGTLTSYTDDDAANLLGIVCSSPYDQGDPMGTPTSRTRTQVVC